MLSDYVPILFVFVLAAGMALGGLGLTHLIGPKVKLKAKLMPYESGLDAASPNRSRLSVRYFIVGLVFIIFDIEVVFLFPWAVIFRDFVVRSPFILYEMLFFMAVLVIGFVYVWRKGVFDWE